MTIAKCKFEGRYNFFVVNVCLPNGLNEVSYTVAVTYKSVVGFVNRSTYCHMKRLQNSRELSLINCSIITSRTML